PFQRLDEWLAEQEREAAAAKEFGKAGFWKRPDIGSMTAPAKVPAREPGEFTKQFQVPATPSAGTGDFTRMFERAGAPTAETTAPLPARPVEAPAAEPGEFTRMFQTQGTPAAAPPAGPAAKATSQPGEFTQLFQSPPQPPAPEPPRASQPGAGPGDFT